MAANKMATKNLKSNVDALLKIQEIRSGVLGGCGVNFDEVKK